MGRAPYGGDSLEGQTDGRLSRGLMEQCTLFVLRSQYVLKNNWEHYTLRTQKSGATVNSAGEFSPGRLWSLLEVLTKTASDFMTLGESIAAARISLEFLEHDDDKTLHADELANLVRAFDRIQSLCDELDLPTSKELFSNGQKDLPKTIREFEIYLNALYSEIKSKTFVYLPTHRRKYFIPKKFIPASVEEAFPRARCELVEAGKCFSFDRYTASVFHCMRAVEIGLRAMAIELEVKIGDIPLELADQEAVIRGIESKISGMKDRKKTAEKDDDLNFYSQTAMQFRYFKDGWRVRTAHTRATYEEGDALSVLEHAASFIGDLSKRLKEPALS
jgi:hypothetical protein